MCKKLLSIHEAHEVKFPIFYRIMLIVLAVVLVGGLLLKSYFDNVNKDTGDKNVYLNEEVCFGDEVFIKVTSLNVQNQEEIDTDEDGDILSNYVLNLELQIEQRHTDFWLNKIKISSENFSLKSVNLEAKSNMSVFFENLFQCTLNAMLSGGIDGSINIIDETAGFIKDYTLASIENAERKKTDFKEIKCNKNQFEPFYPYKEKGSKKINLSFPIKQEYLDSKNVIVLAIDQVTHFEKNIFLVTRPEQ